MAADCDTVKFWLDAAGRYPVLKTDQVLLLAKQIQSNSPESLAYKKALQKLVRHNLKLIPTVARRAMRNKYGKNFGGSYTEDVFQCGVVGLMRAAQKFDPTRGYAFSTYAVGWIYQAMQRDLYNNMSPIRVPENTIREYYTIFVKSNDNLALSDVDPKKMIRYMDAASAIRCRSLDTYRTSGHAEDGLTEGIEVASDDSPKGIEPIDKIIDMSDCSDLAKQMVLDYYQGNLTMLEIGEKNGVSRGRVSKMIQACLKDLREKLSAV